MKHTLRSLWKGLCTMKVSHSWRCETALWQNDRPLCQPKTLQLSLRFCLWKALVTLLGGVLMLGLVAAAKAGKRPKACLPPPEEQE